MSTTISPGVVLVAYHFPPHPAVGSLRAAKVAHAFRDAGHRVDVVTARLPGDKQERFTDDAGVTVHPVSLLPTPDDVYAQLKAWMFGARKGPDDVEPAGRLSWTPPTQVAGWKRLLFSILSLPDDRQGFIIPAWRKAKTLVRAGARLVYSTAPPYSPHLVGLALKSHNDVRWIMELRDPWVDNPQKPWQARTRAVDALDARLEGACLRRADLVVVVSDGLQRRLVERLPAESKARIVLARNGIEHLASAIPSTRRPGPIRIVYAGTFYHSRDPRPFLRGLAAACRKLRIGPEQVHVDFVGSCRTFGPVSVEKEISVLGLTGMVQIRDWLPHAAAKTLIDESDALLLLAQRQPDQVPNKLYEYLGTRRPILAFADADGETARMLQRVGGHQVVTVDDEAEAERAVEGTLATAKRGDWIAENDAVLKEWTTEVQMKRLLEAVNG